MRSQFNVKIEMLDYEIKRNPKIKALCDRIENLSITEAEIEKADVPLKWMKEAMLRKLMLKKAGVNKITDLIKEGKLSDSNGKIYIWTDYEKDVSFGRSVITVKTNEMFLETDKGLWHGYSFFEGIKLPKNSVQYIQDSTITEYKTKHQEKLFKEHSGEMMQIISETSSGGTEQGIGTTEKAYSPTSWKSGVRFSSPNIKF